MKYPVPKLSKDWRAYELFDTHTNFKTLRRLYRWAGFNQEALLDILEVWENDSHNRSVPWQEVQKPGFFSRLAFPEKA